MPPPSPTSNNTCSIRCHCACVTFFPGMSLKHMVLVTSSGRACTSAHQFAQLWMCPERSASGASTVPVLLCREGQVTPLVMGKFS